MSSTPTDRQPSRKSSSSTKHKGKNKAGRKTKRRKHRNTPATAANVPPPPPPPPPHAQEQLRPLAEGGTVNDTQPGNNHNSDDGSNRPPAARRSHLLETHSKVVNMAEGYMRYPYDASSGTGGENPNPGLCIRDVPRPLDWPGATKLIMCHLGNNRPVTSRSQARLVPGPFYMCRSAVDAFRLSMTIPRTLGIQFQPDAPLIHVADIDRQGSLRTRGTVEELAHSYLVCLYDTLLAFVSDPNTPIGSDQRTVLLNHLGDSVATSIAARGHRASDRTTYDDHVAVFESKYVTKPKDSLRIYVANLVWPNVATCAMFHAFWKQRLVGQVNCTIAVPSSLMPHCLRLCDPGSDHPHAIDFSIFTRFRLLRMPFQHNAGYQQKEAFYAIRVGLRLGGMPSFAERQIPSERLFRLGMVHVVAAESDTTVPAENRIVFPNIVAPRSVATSLSASNLSSSIAEVGAPSGSHMLRAHTVSSSGVLDRVRREAGHDAYLTMDPQERSQFLWSVVPLDPTKIWSRERCTVLVKLVRHRSGDCSICRRRHDSENGFLIVSRVGKITLHCFRALGEPGRASSTVSSSTSSSSESSSSSSRGTSFGSNNQVHNDNDTKFVAVAAAATAEDQLEEEEKEEKEEKEGKNGDDLIGTGREQDSKRSSAPALVEFETKSSSSSMSLSPTSDLVPPKTTRKRSATDNIGSNNETRRHRSALVGSPVPASMWANSTSSPSSSDQPPVSEASESPRPVVPDIGDAERSLNCRFLGYTRSVEERRFNDATILEEFDLQVAQELYSSQEGGNKEALVLYCNQNWATVTRGTARPMYIEKVIVSGRPKSADASNLPRSEGDLSMDKDKVVFNINEATGFLGAHKKHNIYCDDNGGNNDSDDDADDDAADDDQADRRKRSKNKRAANKSTSPPSSPRPGRSGSRRRRRIRKRAPLARDDDDYQEIATIRTGTRRHSRASNARSSSDRNNGHPVSDDEALQSLALFSSSRSTPDTTAVQDGRASPEEKAFNCAVWWSQTPDSLGFVTMNLYPNPVECPRRCFNLLNLPVFDPDDPQANADATPFLDHIRKIWCKEDGGLYRYVISWLAWKIRYPWRKLKVCLVAIGEQGAGKNCIVSFLSAILGQHYVQEENEQNIFGSFNSRLRDCLLLVLNESFWSGNPGVRAKLFSLISDTPLTINTKFLPQYEIRNCVDIIICANPSGHRVVPVEPNDRRFVVLDLAPTWVRNGQHTPQEVKRYFDRIHAVPTAAVYKALHAIDLTNFDPADKPRTTATMREKHASLGLTALFLHSILESQSSYAVDWMEIHCKFAKGFHKDKANAPGRMAEVNKIIAAYGTGPGYEAVNGHPASAANQAAAMARPNAPPVLIGNVEPHAAPPWTYRFVSRGTSVLGSHPRAVTAFDTFEFGRLVSKAAVYTAYRNFTDSLRGTTAFRADPDIQFWLYWKKVFGDMDVRTVTSNYQRVQVILTLPLHVARHKFALAQGDEVNNWFGDEIPVTITDDDAAAASE